MILVPELMPLGLVEQVDALTAKVAALDAENVALRGENAALRLENVQLKVENQLLRDEIARLKNLPPRPPFRPSGMEKATDLKAGDQQTGKKKPRGPKLDTTRVSREEVLYADVPAGSRFKGYKSCYVRELLVKAELVHYRRECWLTADGKMQLAPLPAGVMGGYCPNLRRLCLMLHAQGQVTTERLTTLLNEASASSQGRVDEGSRASRHSASHQRIRKRPARLRHQTQNLRRYSEHQRPRCARRLAGADENLSATGSASPISIKPSHRSQVLLPQRPERPVQQDPASENLDNAYQTVNATKPAPLNQFGQFEILPS